MTRRPRPTEAEFDELKRQRDQDILNVVREVRKKLWPDAPDVEPQQFHCRDYNATCYCDCPDGPCQHEFEGWRDITNDNGEVCGGETVCKRCGMGAMQHSLRTAP